MIVGGLLISVAFMVYLYNRPLTDINKKSLKYYKLKWRQSLFLC
jgi:hypothetical protein